MASYQTLLGSSEINADEISTDVLNATTANIISLVIAPSLGVNKVLTDVSGTGLAEWTIIPDPILSGDVNGAATNNIVNSILGGTPATDIVLLDATQTLTNKTLTAPIISTIVNSAGSFINTPSQALNDTLVACNHNQVLSNKTFQDFKLNTGGGVGKLLTCTDVFGSGSWDVPAAITLAGEVSGVQSATVISNAAVISKLITGYVSSVGTVAATDTILGAINKLNGNTAADIANLGTPGSNNVASTIVKRGAAGESSHGALTATTLALTTGAANLRILQSDASGNASWVEPPAATTNVIMGGEVTGNSASSVVDNAAVIGKVITGYASAVGTVAATDTILGAINKLNGNTASVSTALGTPVSIATPSTIAKRDVNGDCYFHLVTATSITSGAVNATALKGTSLQVTDGGGILTLTGRVTGANLTMSNGAAIGAFLQCTDTAGTANWVPLGGDVTGAPTATLVSKINGTAISGASTAATASNLVLRDTSGNIPGGGEVTISKLNWATNGFPVFSLTPGNGNMFIGMTAGNPSALTTGGFNSLIGHNVGTAMTTGSNNTALGGGALRNTATTSYNTAIGCYALDANTTGSNNTALGYGAFIVGTGFSNSTALGANSVITTSNQVVLGGAGVTTVVVPPSLSSSSGTLTITSAVSCTGLTSTSTLKVTTGAGVNKVLVSDATGLATWQGAHVATITGSAALPNEAGLGAMSRINMTTVEVDPEGYWNAANFRYIPQRVGRYLVTAYFIGTAAGAAGCVFWDLAISRNSVTSTAFTTRVPASTSYGPSISITGQYTMNGTTDYLELWGGQGGNVGSVAGYEKMEITYLGA